MGLKCECTAAFALLSSLMTGLQDEIVMNRLRVIAFALTSALAASCATMRPLPPGADRAAVERVWGTPSKVVQTAVGERWEYSSAPNGRLRSIARFSKEGALIQSGPVLNIAHFTKLQPGMSRDDVEDIIGEPYWPMIYNGVPNITHLLWRWQTDHDWMCFSARFDNKTWLLIDSGWYLEEKPSPEIGEARRC
jgi:outer membrane protein assembly factor BamE (lipoprotein component of BamABCDE complex)